MNVDLKKMGRREGKSATALMLLAFSDNACIYVNSHASKEYLKKLAHDLRYTINFDMIRVMSPASLHGVSYSHIIIDDTELFDRNQQDYFISMLPNLSYRTKRLTLLGVDNRMMVEANKYDQEKIMNNQEDVIITVKDKQYEIQFYDFIHNLSQEAYVVVSSGVKQVRDVHNEGGEYLVVKPVRARVPFGEKFWCITGSGKIQGIQDVRGSFSNLEYKRGNYFLNTNDAQVAADKIEKIFEENL